MNIQSYTDEHEWVLAKLDEHVGSFLQAFLHACLAADSQNYEILRPIVSQMMAKYPRISDVQIKRGG